MQTNDRLKIGDIDVPEDYFNLTPYEKVMLCEVLANKIYLLIDRSGAKGPKRLETLNKIIDSSLEMNESEENFEICQVLKDMKNHVNERNR
jgi:hypothetical protein